MKRIRSKIALDHPTRLKRIRSKIALDHPTRLKRIRSKIALDHPTRLKRIRSKIALDHPTRLKRIRSKIALDHPTRLKRIRSKIALDHPTRLKRIRSKIALDHPTRLKSQKLIFIDALLEDPFSLFTAICGENFVSSTGVPPCIECQGNTYRLNKTHCQACPVNTLALRQENPLSSNCSGEGTTQCHVFSSYNSKTAVEIFRNIGIQILHIHVHILVFSRRDISLVCKVPKLLHSYIVKCGFDVELVFVRKGYILKNHPQNDFPSE